MVEHQPSGAGFTPKDPTTGQSNLREADITDAASGHSAGSISVGDGSGYEECREILNIA